MFCAEVAIRKDTLDLLLGCVVVRLPVVFKILPFL